MVHMKVFKFRQSRLNRLYWTTLLLLAVVSVRTLGVAIPPLRLNDLIEGSSLVVVATIEQIDELGPTSVHYNDRVIPASSYSARARVLRSLKGQSASAIVVDFVLPKIPIGYRAIDQGVRLLFLRQSDVGTYSPASAYYPALPAVAERSDIPERASISTEETVISELCNVLTSAIAPTNDKWTILNNSYAVPRDRQQFDAALQKGLNATADRALQRRLQAESLYRNDISQLENVSELLKTNGISGIQKERFLYSIANGVNNEKAVPQLAGLLSDGDESVRSAAAEALWHTASHSAVPVLCKALRDSSSQVRYYVIRALADITGQREWGPSIPEYQRDGTRYLQHWLEWADRSS